MPRPVAIESMTTTLRLHRRHAQRVRALSVFAAVTALSMGLPAQSPPSDSLRERVLRSAAFVVEYSADVAPASLQWVRSSSAPSGLYYDLGRIRRAGITAADDDVLSEIVLEQAWLLTVRKAFTDTFGPSTWQARMAQAQQALDRYVVAANVDRRDANAVADIRRAMARERDGLTGVVHEYAARRHEPAFANGERSLAAQKYQVVVTTDPAGAEMGYVTVHEAAMQVARTNARFPDQIGYHNVTTPRLELGGSYVFRVKWSGLTKYFPGVRVTGADDIRLARGAS